MRTAFIALGSNLKNRKKNIALAIKLLNAVPGVSVTKASSLYETNPVGGPSPAGRFRSPLRGGYRTAPLTQPKYLNGAIKVKTSLEAEELLCEMKKIERKMGRPLVGEKGYVKNGPRIIDLDLLLFGKSTIKRKGLIVPHPRMHKRPFVLMPLAEVSGRAK